LAVYITNQSGSITLDFFLILEVLLQFSYINVLNEEEQKQENLALLGEGIQKKSKDGSSDAWDETNITCCGFEPRVLQTLKVKCQEKTFIQDI